MRFFNKIKWILGISVVFLLIITTNLIDRNNFITVRDSVATIYEDRLIAKDIVFDISLLINEKKLANVLEDSIFFKNKNSAVNNNIDQLLLKFESTKLTTKERSVFLNLKEELNELYKKEVNTSKNKTEINSQIEAVEYTLQALSNIQIQEGAVQLSLSKKALDSIELFTKLEIYFLIFLAVIIQIIILYNPKDKKPEED